MTYDRGYTLQTKSLLLESTTTVSETVAQLFDTLSLRGSPADYALEQRNSRTGGEHRGFMGEEGTSSKGLEVLIGGYAAHIRLVKQKRGKGGGPTYK